jgi:hypothetical protein
MCEIGNRPWIEHIFSDYYYWAIFNNFYFLIFQETDFTVEQLEGKKTNISLKVFFLVFYC